MTRVGRRRVLALARRGGVVSARQALARGIHSQELTRLVAEGVLERTARGQYRLPVQVDIGFGDAVTPAPVRELHPVLLDQSAPNILACPREAVVAEKLEAMVSLGVTNSRMNFYDIRSGIALDDRSDLLRFYERWARLDGPVLGEVELLPGLRSFRTR